MPAKAKKKLSNNKKALIIIAIVVASLLTVGSAYAYYNFVKENLAQNQPKLKRQLINQTRKQIQKNKPAQGLLKGEVGDKSDNLLILDINNEDWKVNLSDKTRYREDGQKISKDDITVGDRISVFGKKDIKNKTADAILIRKMD